MNYLKISLAALGLFVGAAIGSANAADLASPGVYFGTGNTNGNFVINAPNRSGIEIGQRAIHRYADQITPVGNVYTVPTGLTSVPGRTGADWGFTFSVNTNVNGNGSNTLANTTSTLFFTDSHTGASGSLDIEAIGDNYHALGLEGTTFQNSEALSFPLVALALSDPFYDVNAASIYTFTIEVRDAVGSLLATNTIVVNAVPEPLTLSLFAAGLVGAGALRRRKKVHA